MPDRYPQVYLESPSLLPIHLPLLIRLSRFKFLSMSLKELRQRLWTLAHDGMEREHGDVVHLSLSDE